MVKFTKEYSDAFGFPLLGRFANFITEYPVEGSQIQKICDEDFKATCMKCYPIIVSTGVDPTTYQPSTGCKPINKQLRELFPVKKVLKPPTTSVVVDESTSSADEDETECVVVRTNIITPPIIPAAAAKKMEDERVVVRTNIITPPRIPAAAAKKIEASLKCADCSVKDKVIEELKKTIEVTNKRSADLERMHDRQMANNDALCSKMDELVNLNKQYSDKLQATKAELEAEKKKSEHRYHLWQNLMKDPDYIAFVEFRKFETFKRKRTQ